VFAKVAEVGSFAAVADALVLSAPMVGKHVRFLEIASAPSIKERRDARP